MVDILPKEEFYREKAEAERKGQRWKVFIDKDYGSDCHTEPIDESTLTEADKKRIAENQRIIDELKREIEEDKRKESEKKQKEEK